MLHSSESFGSWEDKPSSKKETGNMYNRKKLSKYWWDCADRGCQTLLVGAQNFSEGQFGNRYQNAKYVYILNLS